jgi:low affinity Fe/Cu permease
MSGREPPVDREPSPLRRLLSWVDRWTSRPLTALIVIALVIQHTQSREQSATQRTLDEILRALPGADNSLLMLGTRFLR